MTRSRQIAIDVEVHRAIESARRAFSESENDILRRLLLSQTDNPPPDRGATESGPKTRGHWWNRASNAAPVPSRSTEQRSRGNFTVVVGPDRYAAANLKDAYRTLLLKLTERTPGFLEEFAQQSSRTRRFVARSAIDLYRNSPHLVADHAKPLIDDWFYDTNLSSEQVGARARTAARLCGLRYGSDVRILDNLREI